MPKTKAAADTFNEIATVRVDLVGTDPPIWRQVEVPTSMTLKRLHDVVQIVIGWADYHLWQFTIGDRHYSLYMDQDWGAGPRGDAAKVRLRDVLGTGETVIDYMYDFGDNWEHRLTVTDVRAGDPEQSYPRYIGGERNGPPEDCGGIFGFYEALDAAADPNHPEHADFKDMLEGYDPDEIEMLPIKFGLSRIANQRNAVKVRLAKKQAASG